MIINKELKHCRFVQNRSARRRRRKCMARLYVKIKDQDNVVVAVQDLKAGTEIMEGLVTNQDIPQAHKIALCDIPAGGGDHSLRRCSRAMRSTISRRVTGSMSICWISRRARL